MSYASKDPQPLNEIAILDQTSIDAIVAQLPTGGYTHPSTHPATMITPDATHQFVTTTEKSNIHALGSDNQDLSGLVVKESGKSLVADTEISKIHSSESDNQDLSNLVVKVSGSSLVADTEIAKIHTNTLDHSQGTDQGLDTGGANAVTAAQAKAGYTHSGIAHAPSTAQANADITKGEIEAKLTGEISSHSHAGGGAGMNLLKKTANQTINAGAATFVDIDDLTFPVVSGTDYAFHFYITFQSAATATGHKFGVNCPNGTLDFWAWGDVIANGAAGVATHTLRHNVVRDDMTLLATSITANVDLAVRIEGRYMCTQNGTFACRFANELAANTQIVVQKGSWGYWF